MALLLSFTLLFSSAALSKGVYQTVPEFLDDVFISAPPKQAYLWLTPELKESASKIIGHQVRGMRVRYWASGKKTAWVMEEIGKELPITIGVVVSQDRINQVKILAFRESRGGEVRYPAFTAQYQNVKIMPDNKLDTHIDGITGATLSVRAVTKVTTLALFYHQQITQHQSKLIQNREHKEIVTESP